MRATLLLVSLPLLFAGPVLAQSPPPSSGQPIGQSAKEFLDFAAYGNQAEIRAGLMAEKKAQSDAVKAFARLMVNDHMALESQLAAVASLDHVQLPNGINQTQQQQASKLNSASGPQFDSAYINDQVQDHEKIVQRFESEKSSAHDPTILTAASGALPILKQHLALAKAVQASLNNESVSR